MLLDVAPQLNSNQQLAVDSREGYFACMAGPGSGKTKVLVERYSALRKEGVPAEDILSLTFTNKAAAEMRKRAEKACVGTAPKTCTRPSGFCTFHALGLAFLKREGADHLYPLADQPIASERLITQLSEDIARKFPQLKPGVFLQMISKHKRDGIPPEKVLALTTEYCEFRQGYQEYVDTLRNRGMLDFDDLLLFMADRLHHDEKVWKRWQFDFLLIDESQDADKLQWDIVASLSSMKQNVFAAGDPNQCIYSFRGARPDLFSKWEQLFPNRVQLVLGQNYRSTPEIVAYLRKVAPVQDTLTESFCSANDHGSEPQSAVYETTEDEVFNIIRKCKDSTLGSTVILARTRAYLRAFEDRCIVESIRCCVLESNGFWGENEPRLTRRWKRGTTLGTIHSAKGLQWDTVFVVGAQEGMIPHERATNLDEEARVFFVAVSRAARNLFVSYVGQPSRFLNPKESK